MEALDAVIKIYGTKNVWELKRSANQGEGECFTFMYSSEEAKLYGDKTGGRFIVGPIGDISEMVKYDHDLWPKVADTMISLVLNGTEFFTKAKIFLMSSNL